MTTTPRLWVDPAEQREADAYWADRPYKKWVVLFSRGPAYRREHREVFVGAASKERAVAVAVRVIAAMHGWRGSNVHARLATYIDLGCVRTPGSTA